MKKRTCVLLVLVALGSCVAACSSSEGSDTTLDSATPHETGADDVADATPDSAPLDSRRDSDADAAVVVAVERQPSDDHAVPPDSAEANCVYPPANNDPLCPVQYSSSHSGQPCSPIGLTCEYPGAGDFIHGQPCIATAELRCRGDGGADDGGEGGADAGAGSWLALQ